MTAISKRDSPAALRSWLVEQVAEMLEKKPGHIEADVPLADYGLDSVYGLNLTAVIEDELGISLEPTVLWDHPTIDELVVYLTHRH